MKCKVWLSIAYGKTVYAQSSGFFGKKNPMLEMQGLETELRWFLRGEKNRTSFPFSLNSVFYMFGFFFLLFVKPRFVVVFIIVPYSFFNSNTIYNSVHK